LHIKYHHSRGFGGRRLSQYYRTVCRPGPLMRSTRAGSVAMGLVIVTEKVTLTRIDMIKL